MLYFLFAAVVFLQVELVYADDSSCDDEEDCEDVDQDSLIREDDDDKLKKAGGPEQSARISMGAALGMVGPWQSIGAFHLGLEDGRKAFSLQYGEGILSSAFKFRNQEFRGSLRSRVLQGGLRYLPFAAMPLYVQSVLAMVSSAGHATRYSAYDDIDALSRADWSKTRDFRSFMTELGLEVGIQKYFGQHVLLSYTIMGAAVPLYKTYGWSQGFDGDSDAKDAVVDMTAGLVAWGVLNLKIAYVF